LYHLAELISVGEARFPKGLSPAVEQQLGQAIREHRRRRLIQFIGRAVAREIWRQRGS